MNRLLLEAYAELLPPAEAASAPDFSRQAEAIKEAIARETTPERPQAAVIQYRRLP